MTGPIVESRAGLRCAGCDEYGWTLEQLRQRCTCKSNLEGFAWRVLVAMGLTGTEP